jgi:exosortase
MNGVLEDFRLEFLECWRRLPNKGLFLALCGAWLLLFHYLGNATLGYIRTPSLLTWMYVSYHPEGENPIYDDGHGQIVPFVVLGLFWWKRKQLLALPLQGWAPGLAILALGLLLHIAGFAIQQPRVSIVGLFVGIFGLMGLAWGPFWLGKAFFPYWLFVFCVPFGSLSEMVTFPLRLLVTSLVEAVSHYILAIDVVRVGTALYDPSGRYQYEVAAACSGIRSLVAIFILALVYGVVCFRNPWKRLLLIAAAFPLAVAGNLFRMLVIVIAAEMGGQDWGNSAHSNTILSILPYIPAILGLLLAGRYLEEAPTAPQAPTPKPA